MVLQLLALRLKLISAYTLLQVEPTRWLVDIRSRTLAALPLSTAGGAVRKAAEGALPSRSILTEGDLIAVRVQSEPGGALDSTGTTCLCSLHPLLPATPEIPISTHCIGLSIPLPGHCEGAPRYLRLPNSG